MNVMDVLFSLSISVCHGRAVLETVNVVGKTKHEGPKALDTRMQSLSMYSGAMLTWVRAMQSMVLDASWMILTTTTFTTLMLLTMTTLAAGLWLIRLIRRSWKVAIEKWFVEVGDKDGDDPQEWRQKRPIPFNNEPENLMKEIEDWGTSQEHHGSVGAKSKAQKVRSKHCP